MITVKFFPKYVISEERQEFRFAYSRANTIKDYIQMAGMDIEHKRVIVSGKRVDNLNKPLDNEDEILLLPEVEIPAVIAVIKVFVTLAIAYAKAHPFIFWGTVLSLGYSIYQAVNQPRLASFSAGGIEDDSPTYSWDGIATTQEVGTVVPIIYGEHKAGGNIINAYMTNDGEKDYLNALLSLCEGEIDDITDIKINDNPVENFDGITIHKRSGTNDQEIIPYFEDAHNLYSVSVELSKDNPHTYTTIDSDVQAFEVILQLPNGLFQQSSDGAIASWEVSYKVEYKLHAESSWIDLGNNVINAKTRTKLKRVFRKEGLSASQYDIRVTRTSEDSSLDPLRTGDLYWIQVDEIKTDDFIYPNTALLGIQALATEQLSGSMPNFSCVVKGRKISVPHIKNGSETVHWQDYYWDGNNYRLFSDDTILTWDSQEYIDLYCANPIWCLKDLLLNKQFGLGEFIEISHIDEDLFLEMSRYCEEKISNGDSGYEKRFRLDVVIDSSTKALDLLVKLGASFRLLPFYSEGSIKLRIDKQDEPVQLFGMGNIIENSFLQQWKSIKDVPNVIEIQFLDKDKDYEQETIAVIDEEALSSGDPMRKKQIRLFTTQMSYALREARYALKVAKYINRSISFKAGIDAVAVQAGDLINVSHDVPEWGFSGRVISGIINSITLDQTVTIQDGKSYKVLVKFSDDAQEEKTVINPSGDYTTLDIEGSFSQTPQAYDLYSFGEVNKIVKPFRVLSLQKENKNEVAITAVEYNESVYDDSAITLPTNNYSSLDLTIPNVSDLQLTERIVTLGDGTIENAIDVWFNKPEESNSLRKYAKARIYISEDNANWTFRGETTGTQYAITGDLISGGTYYVKVVTVTEDDEEGQLSSSPWDSITLINTPSAPASVSNFSYNFDDDLELTWNNNPEANIAGYEIRSVDNSWGVDNADLIYRGQTNSFAYQPDSRSPGTLYIKAYNTSGVYSTNSQSVVPYNNPPQAPTVTATPFFDLVLLRWDDSLDVDLQYYEIWQSATGAWAGEEALIHKTQGTSAILKVDATEATLYFKVRGVDLYGVGSFSGSYQANFVQIDQDDLGADSITSEMLQDAAVTTKKTAFINHMLSAGTWSDNSPSANYIAWSGVKVVYNGIEYVITDGNTNNTYIWWDFSLSTTTFQTSNTKPALENVDFLVCINDAGIHRLVWDATLIHGSALMTGSIDTEELAANSITAEKLTTGELITLSAQIKDGIIENAKIANLDGSKINADSITANKYNQLRNTYVYNAEDSLDSNYPFEIPFKIVSELVAIQSIKLSFKILNFRSYSTGIPSGGGSTTPAGGGATSGSGGGQTSSATGTPSGGGSTSGAVSNSGHSHYISLVGAGISGVRYSPELGSTGLLTEPSGFGPVATSSASGHSHNIRGKNSSVGNQLYYSGGNFYCSGGGQIYTDTVDGHYHVITIYDGTPGSQVGRYSANSLGCSGGGSVYTGNGIGSDHTHTTPNHSHPDHTHTVSDHAHATPNHSHSTPDHSHSLSFGIYEEANSPTINVYIDNSAGYGSSIGAYTQDQTDLDITPYISSTGWKRVKFTTNARCRISGIIECKIDIEA